MCKYLYIIYYIYVIVQICIGSGIYMAGVANIVYYRYSVQQIQYVVDKVCTVKQISCVANVMCSRYGMKQIQCVSNTVCSRYSVQQIKCVAYVMCYRYSVQEIQCSRYSVYCKADIVQEIQCVADIVFVYCKADKVLQM